ncbi:MAG: hypothetical protein Q8M29_15430 [Bacteroidota bacterium]|nr:hypothetical protein [Bacteroidota bacterium]
MITIKHQLSPSNLYFPHWEVKHLFVGTFNPTDGKPVKYYYGRKSNMTWKLVSNIFEMDFNQLSPNFIDGLIKYKIACVDLINAVVIGKDLKNKVTGEGYKDSAIINKKVKRGYNTKRILELISDNPGIKVYSTWGKGSNLKEWKNECGKIPNLNSLLSPSMAARVPKGEEKFQYVLKNWRYNITIK